MSLWSLWRRGAVSTLPSPVTRGMLLEWLCRTTVSFCLPLLLMSRQSSAVFKVHAHALTECVSISFLTPARMVQSRFLTQLPLSHVNCVLPLTNRLSYAQLRLRTSTDEQACQPTVQFRQHRVCAIILFFVEICSHCCIKARGHLKDGADASDRWSRTRHDWGKEEKHQASWSSEIWALFRPSPFLCQATVCWVVKELLYPDSNTGQRNWNSTQLDVSVDTAQLVVLCCVSRLHYIKLQLSFWLLYVVKN